MVSRAWLLNVAIVAAILSPVVPAVAGATQQDESSNPPQQTLPRPDAAKQQEAIKGLPPGPGRDAVVRVCSGCHLLTVVTSERKSESDWTDTVVEMRGRGANATDDDMVAIVEYLAKNYGPNSPAPAAATPAPAAAAAAPATSAASAKVDVNTASAAAIASGLGLTQDEAQAIVAYREKNGKFTDIAGLKQVPGIDAAKIDAGKDKVEF